MSNVYTYHGEEAAGDPDNEGEVDAAGGLEHAGGGHEDARADDAAHDDGAPVQQSQVSLQLDPLALGLVLVAGRALLLELEGGVVGVDELVAILVGVQV